MKTFSNPPVLHSLSAMDSHWIFATKLIYKQTKQKYSDKIN